MRQLDGMVGQALVRVCRAHRQGAEAALATIGLHAGQEMLVLLLAAAEGDGHHPAQGELAEWCGIEAPTMTRMVQRLEREGIVDRVPDPDDARTMHVRLTARGRDLEAAILGVWTALEERLVAGLSASERTTLRRLLTKAYAGLSD